MRLHSPGLAHAEQLREAFLTRQPFTLIGAGVKVQYVASQMSTDYDPLPSVSLELQQVAFPVAATEWDGEGLPPVGTVCEFNGGESVPEDPWDPDLQVGDQVEIIAHFDGGNGDILAAFTFHTMNINRGAVAVEQGRWGCFRPIRTPEQIATEQALREIEQLYAEGGPAAVYDAGYRK